MRHLTFRVGYFLIVYGSLVLADKGLSRHIAHFSGKRLGMSVDQSHAAANSKKPCSKNFVSSR